MLHYPNKHSNVEPKRYVQINVIRVVDRNTEIGEKVWRELIDHHCFRGNDTMMVLERFYSASQNMEELEKHEEQGEPIGEVEKFFTQLLHDRGYFYDKEGYLVDVESSDRYDGALLDISW